MPIRTHRRRNFKKRSNVRNRTKRNTRRNTKRRLNRRIKRTKRYTRKRGGNKDYWIKKSDRLEAEEAAAALEQPLEYKTVVDEKTKKKVVYYQNPKTGKWFIDTKQNPKGKATRLGKALFGEKGAAAVRGVREKVLKPVGRAVEKGPDSLLTMELGGIDIPL